jgi:hypothetical protein
LDSAVAVVPPFDVNTLSFDPEETDVIPISDVTATVPDWFGSVNVRFAVGGRLLFIVATQFAPASNICKESSLLMFAA